MSVDNWGYVVEVNGEHYQQYEGKNEYETGKKFREHQYFNSLFGAVACLIQYDLRSFDNNIVSIEQLPRFIETASIRDLKTKETICVVNRISFEDSPKAAPPAGIYFHFHEDLSAERIAQTMKMDFTGFEDYDPEAPFLLLAELIYDRDGLRLNYDRGYQNLVLQLKQGSHPQQAAEDSWRYAVAIKGQDKGYYTPEFENRYHYPALTPAIYGLVGIDIMEMDFKKLMATESSSVISSAVLSDHKNPLLELKTRYLGFSEGASQVAISLMLHSDSLSYLEKAGLNLTNLNVKDGYADIFHYYPRINDCLPTPDLLGQLYEKNDTGLQAGPLATSSRYMVELVWDSLPAPSSGKEFEYRARRYYENVDHAFYYIFNLDESLFYPDKARELGLPLYIKKVTVTDTDDGQEMMHKFVGETMPNGIPPAVTIAFNQDKIGFTDYEPAKRQLSYSGKIGSQRFLIYSKEHTGTGVTSLLRRERNPSGRVQDNPGSRGLSR